MSQPPASDGPYRPDEPLSPAPPQPAYTLPGTRHEPGPHPVPPQPAAPVFAPGSAAVSGPPVTGPPAGAAPAYAPPEPTMPMGQQPAGYPPPAGYPQPAEFARYSPPISGAPYLPAYAGAPAEPPARRGRGATITLSIVAAILLIAAGGLSALYLTTSSEFDRTERRLSAQVADRDNTIASQDGEIEQLKKDLQTNKDELAEVRQTLTGTQNSAEEVKRQKAVIVKCINLISEATELADAGRTSQARAKFAEADPVCTEADRYLVP